MKVSRRLVIHSTASGEDRVQIYAVLAARDCPYNYWSTSLRSSETTPKLGFLSGLSASAIPTRLEAFKQGLNELGYSEGKNIITEYRWARESWIGFPSWRPS
ncbi:MAG TPA: hypothetical protein VHK27_01895 [Gammaproteobacteria bacterium]|nr:hypothetical protein [Gammaproteobacteria bacterium]